MPAAGQDLRTVTLTRLTARDQQEVLALWLAVEMVNPAVRDADLAVLLAPPVPGSTSAKFEPFLLRSLPFDFPVGQELKAPLVESLHTWLETVGREQGLRLVGEVLPQQEGTFDLVRLLAALSQRSGVPIEYQESE